MPSPSLTHTAAGTRCRGLASAAAVLLALACAPAAQAQTDWTRCADEGGVCRFAGEALVRFGAAGDYRFRIARQRVMCDADEFGEAAPGQRRSCDVSFKWRDDPRYRAWPKPGQPATGSRSAEWRPCAPEGAECRAEPGSRVRFGVNGRYETRTVQGPVACTPAQFGDPAPGQLKRCEVEVVETWVLCAYENETCRVPAETRVRYGLDGQYVERRASDSIACNNATFGDPVREAVKVCEYLRPAPVAAAPAPAPWPAVRPNAFGHREHQWSPCAAEDKRCEFAGVAIVRYGQAGQYLYREASHGIDCSSTAFGGDPAKGQLKQCEVLTGWR